MTAPKPESFSVEGFSSLGTMALAKSDLRARVCREADKPFLETGTIEGFNYGEVRTRVKGSANGVTKPLNEWKASRRAIMSSMPASFVTAVEDAAARLWLMANLLLDKGVALPVAQSDTIVSPDRGRLGSASPNDTVQDRPIVSSSNVAVGRRSRKKDSRYPLFSDIPRPLTPGQREKAKGKRPQPARRSAPPITLVAPPTKPVRVAVGEADWKGARNERLAKAVATILRAKGDRLRGPALYNALAPSLRPGIKQHIVRDLRKELAGSKITFERKYGFWFKDEPIRKKQRIHKKTRIATHRWQSQDLWWRIVHAIAQLGRGFTEAELSAACGAELERYGKDWLRLRLLRAKNAKPPVVKSIGRGVYQWTGLDPAKVARQQFS
ncbi:DNA-binding protein [Bradyrhizobium sp. Ec3.3]|uniref:DNA-binding protein n=1 Tax=Bradyrhizobium sp. Ec3.3 TaxID=189753 RepID=UPI0012EC116D|nr:DNA-binding protein [Bradyrhizobium sp. Ec3.3]